MPNNDTYRDVNLNIRISRDLRARLKAFAKQQGIQVTTLLTGEIELLLARGRPRQSRITRDKQVEGAVMRTAREFDNERHYAS